MGSPGPWGCRCMWRFSNFSSRIRLKSSGVYPGRGCEAASREAGQRLGRPQDGPLGPSPLFPSPQCLGGEPPRWWSRRMEGAGIPVSEAGTPGALAAAWGSRGDRPPAPRPAVGLLHAGPAARSSRPRTAQGQKRPQCPRHLGRHRRVWDGGRSRQALSDHRDTALTGGGSDGRESRSGRGAPRSLTGVSELRPPW